MMTYIGPLNGYMTNPYGGNIGQVGMAASQPFGASYPQMTPAQQGLAQAWQYGYDSMMKIMENQLRGQLSSLASSTGSGLVSMQSGLENFLNTNKDKLTDSQRAEIEAIIQKIKAKTEEFKEYCKSKDMNNMSYEELKNLQTELQSKVSEVQELQKEVSDLLDKITKEVQEAQAASGSGEGGSDGSSGGSAGGSDEGGVSQSGRPAELGAAPKESELEQICASIENRIAGAGTDEEGLKTDLTTFVNSGNIIELLEHWEETRGKHSENEGMIARILKDLNDGEQKEMVPIIRDALIERAEALGIYNDIKKEVAAVNKELLYERHWYWNMFGGQDDDTIKNNLMAIYDKIKAKEAGAAKTAKADEDKKKAEADKKAEEQKAKVVPEKMESFKKELMLALKLKEVPEIVSELKVNTDENGNFKDYSIEIGEEGNTVTLRGKTYNELAKELVRYGLDPKEILIKEPVNA